MMVKNAKITKQIEEGCLRFDVIKQNGSENSFAFVEVYIVPHYPLQSWIQFCLLGV